MSALHYHVPYPSACQRAPFPFQTSNIGSANRSCLLVRTWDLLWGLQGDDRAWDLHALVVVIGATARVVAAVPEAVVCDETLDVIQGVLEQVHFLSLQ